MNDPLYEDPHPELQYEVASWRNMNSNIFPRSHVIVNIASSTTRSYIDSTVPTHACTTLCSCVVHY